MYNHTLTYALLGGIMGHVLSPIAHRELPSADVLSRKGFHNVLHPVLNSFVQVQLSRVNQFKCTISVDFWSVPYKIKRDSIGSLVGDYNEYTLKLHKDMIPGSKGLKCALGGTLNIIEVMSPDCDYWLVKLWEFCTNENNIVFDAL